MNLHTYIFPEDIQKALNEFDKVSITNFLNSIYSKKELKSLLKHYEMEDHLNSKSIKFGKIHSYEINKKFINFLVNRSEFHDNHDFNLTI